MVTRNRPEDPYAEYYNNNGSDWDNYYATRKPTPPARSFIIGSNVYSIAIHDAYD